MVAITRCRGPAMAAIAQDSVVPMLQRLGLLGAESLPDLLGEAWEADPGHEPWAMAHGPWAILGRREVFMAI